MKSILQEDTERCFLCGGYENGDPFDKHHIFGAFNRKKSEQYGLYVFIHHWKCHLYGKHAVHNNADTMRLLHEKGQRAAMKTYSWTKDEFREIFGKNYL